jgi:hypothetical protein
MCLLEGLFTYQKCAKFRYFVPNHQKVRRKPGSGIIFASIHSLKQFLHSRYKNNDLSFEKLRLRADTDGLCAKIEFYVPFVKFTCQIPLLRAKTTKPISIETRIAESVESAGTQFASWCFMHSSKYIVVLCQIITQDI